MKRISIFLMVILVLATSCSEDDITVKSRTSSLTPEQVAAGAAVSKDRAEAILGGMYAKLTEYAGVYDWQSDFGYPGMAARLEHAGDGVVSTTATYNWFGYSQLLQTRAKTSGASQLMWSYPYQYIKLANDVIVALGGNKEDAEIKTITSQAYAFRAFAYMFLAQNFQFTYKGNEEKPCVPIVTDTTDPAIIANNPRATVKAVYELIIADLNKAIEGFPDGPAKAKNAISKAVALGLRARANLIMNNWAAAAADAQAAIDATAATPYTIEDCSIPNFDDVATSKNTMWGIIITSEDDVTKTGICNWTSMFTSLAYGSVTYTATVGCYKRINTRLFDLISDTDIRKGWWASEELKDETGEVIGYTSPAVRKAYPELYAAIAGKMKEYPHTVVKFAPTNKDPLEKENSVDFQLMRVEEMYYILAEAKAMGGDVAGGKQVLESFVKTYRDPQYVCKANSSSAFQDEIYLQKRIEFWGEGISWFDMMRMNKGIDRVDVATRNTGGYAPTTRLNVAPGDPVLLFQIPLKEEQANKAIEGNNNPSPTPPTDAF